MGDADTSSKAETVYSGVNCENSQRGLLKVNITGQ